MTEAVLDGFTCSLAEILATLNEDEQTAVRAAVGEVGWLRLSGQWALTARPAQLAPAGDWRLWLMLAGRGFGKTRAGAQWVDALARGHRGLRIALVGATAGDVRRVMVEGDSGILNLPTVVGPRPLWRPTLNRLAWPGGSIATCYSAAEPESLRGPQHHFAWADEVGRWGLDSDGAGAVAAWDNLMLGLRLGKLPRALATTTPRATALIRRLLATQMVVVTGGASDANAAHLAPAWLASMRADYAGTQLARQELDGELIEDVPGALWTRALLERCRMPEAQVDRDALVRVVIGVDPPATSHGDACGIIVVGRTADGIAIVLHDGSVERASPDQWARAVAQLARRHDADRVVAEANNGGEMVAQVLRAAMETLPLKLVHATRSKVARAEPVATLYERGRVRHAAALERLEDELCGLLPGGGYAGPGRSPDRADAAIWALTELMLGGRSGAPGVRGL